MSSEEIKDLSASVHRRLLDKARADKRPFNELLQYYAMERFLYRLSKSLYSRKFILKGALMLFAWDAPTSRPTADIDLLGSVENDVTVVVSVVREICLQDVEPDGLAFNTESVTGEIIVEIAEYPGVRVRVGGNLGTALVKNLCKSGSFSFPRALGSPQLFFERCRQDGTMACFLPEKSSGLCPT